MINGYEIDWDGFNLLVDEREEELRGEELSYDQLLRIAAVAQMEVEHDADIYKLDMQEMQDRLNSIEHDKSLSLEKVREIAREGLMRGAERQKGISAIHAVSHREDQKQKQGWLEHCRRAKQSGKGISTLDDLLGIAGYDPLVTKITSRTLKAWAKKEGIELKPGRPKK